jgi:RNA-directed DNA polymerase
VSDLLDRVTAWENLLVAFGKAARRKRGREAAATFEHQVADRLLQVQEELRSGTYRHGPYRSFFIHSPKLRKISASPFRDRVVHHALCNVLEPLFERRFIFDSYANRRGKGTHRAIDRLQSFARAHRYVLRLDVVKHFPSMDHAVLLRTLGGVIREDDVMTLVREVVASGEGVLEDQLESVSLPGECSVEARVRGLPIGNLTSQFWSNCYLNPFDHFVKRELRCRSYVRYVDDFALFSDRRQELWSWKRAIVERMAMLRLRLHERSGQVTPVSVGIPWLGFIVFPTHRRVKARTVRNFTRRIRTRWEEYHRGEISFAEFAAAVRGWINHVRFADTWGLRGFVLRQLPVCGRE